MFTTSRDRARPFKIYLPRIQEAVTVTRPSQEHLVRSGSETLLVVEDDEGVRSIVRKTLESLGYKVKEARSPNEALKIMHVHAEPIHLLLTDIVMPEMNGKGLAIRVTAAHPETKVLFMSGYADDAVVRHGILEAGLFFVQKPFTPESLARKVREVLEWKKVSG